MARLVRADLVDPSEVATFHCLNRCVRRGYLCGDDPHTGHNYNHRKQWLEERLEWLAAHFGIDLIGFSILSNHFHLILRSRPDVVAAWDDSEVARRWMMLCPVRKDDQRETMGGPIRRRFRIYIMSIPPPSASLGAQGQPAGGCPRLAFTSSR
jgi:hypothetical protein